jgi:hypothetical protein
VHGESRRAIRPNEASVTRSAEVPLLANTRRHDQGIASCVSDHTEFLTWSANFYINSEMRAVIGKISAR